MRENFCMTHKTTFRNYLLVCFHRWRKNFKKDIVSWNQGLRHCIYPLYVKETKQPPKIKPKPYPTPFGKKVF
jgi:hypothetical protein